MERDIAIEEKVYVLLQEMDALVNNPKNLLTTTDIARLQSTLHAILTLFEPEKTPPPVNHFDALQEARRAPLSRPKLKWYQKILG